MILLKNIAIQGFRSWALLWGGVCFFVMVPSVLAQELDVTLERRIRQKWIEVTTSQNKSVSMARFIGYVEGSLNVCAPAEWTELVMAAVSSDNEIDYSLRHIQSREKRWSVLNKGSNRQVDIPASSKISTRVKDVVQSSAVSYAINGNRLFFLSSETSQFEGKLACLDLDGGQEVWSSPADPPEADGVMEFTTGVKLGGSFVVANSSRLVVFSWKAETASVLTLDQVTGRETSRVELRARNVQEKTADTKQGQAGQAQLNETD